MKAKKFAALNPTIALRDGFALILAINASDHIACKQLLREYETSYPAGYGRYVVMKAIGLMNENQKEFLRGLYT